jgi:hypothetical protein
MRIDDDKAANGSRVLAGHVMAGIAVVRQPNIAADLANKDHDVMAAYCGHAGRGMGAGKAEPIGGKVQVRLDDPEQKQRCFAAAELKGASVRPMANNVAVGVEVAMMVGGGVAGTGQQSGQANRG